jgi:hypothetical protein
MRMGITSEKGQRLHAKQGECHASATIYRESPSTVKRRVSICHGERMAGAVGSERSRL